MADVLCQWGFNHSDEKVPATNLVRLPGDPNDGVDWFGGPEPDIRLLLCGPCTNMFVEQNGRAVIVEVITSNAAEAPFSQPRREAFPR